MYLIIHFIAILRRNILTRFESTLLFIINYQQDVIVLIHDILQIRRIDLFEIWICHRHDAHHHHISYNTSTTEHRTLPMTFLSESLLSDLHNARSS